MNFLGKPNIRICLLMLMAAMVALSCDKKKPEESSDAAIDTLATIVENSEQSEDYTFSNEYLISYKDFIDHLDPSKVDNIQVATDKFKSSFKGADPATCDSAYYIF